ERQLSDKLLESPVLVLERPEPLRLAHVHPAELRLPAVEGLLADPVAAAKLGCLRPRLGLLQDADDLLVLELAASHRSVHFKPGPLTSNGQVLGGNVIQQVKQSRCSTAPC